MASIIRSAKSGSSWTDNELIAFNITVVDTDIQTFFGIDQLPPPGVSDVILQTEGMPDDEDLEKVEWSFFALLEDAMSLTPGQESSVDDFARFLLELLGYDSGKRVIHSRRELNFTMCGQRVDAKTDICVMRRIGLGAQYVLLVQEDKVRCHLDLNAAPLTTNLVNLVAPPIFAAACAAFAENNAVRSRARVPLLDKMTFPGITLVGSTPTFYKITVTKGLIIALATGQYPEKSTNVEKFLPPVDNPLAFYHSGMKHLNDRAVVFQCFQAFKQLMHKLDVWDR
ncbi:hypothetical protein ONZ45_g12479 [Pleurotus djamor]|nr:hypothetical protein ONZ45_g12479 [Pleurotus djamor]